MQFLLETTAANGVSPVSLQNNNAKIHDKLLSLNY
jgi:hypothetical protein